MIDSYVLFSQWIEIFWHAEFVVRSELIPVWNKVLIWDMKPKMTHAAFSGLIGYRIWPPQTKPHQIKLDSRRYSPLWKPGRVLMMLLLVSALQYACQTWLPNTTTLPKVTTNYILGTEPIKDRQKWTEKKALLYFFLLLFLLFLASHTWE